MGVLVCCAVLLGVMVGFGDAAIVFEIVIEGVAVMVGCAVLLGSGVLVTEAIKNN